MSACFAITHDAQTRRGLVLIEQDRLAYSVEEFARLTGKTAAAIRADIHRGVVPARKWGRRTVVLHDDAMPFLRGLPLRRSEAEDDRGAA